MSGIHCERPNHERCERCGGCVTCGCLCHLAGVQEHQWVPDEERRTLEGQVDHLRCSACEEPSDGEHAEEPCPGAPRRCPGCDHHAGEGCGCPPQDVLTLESLGLRPYDLDSEERACPKCGFGNMQVVYHPNVILTVGETVEGSFPCGAWVMAGILSDQTTQHLCLRCMRCNYGYPTKTADAP